MTAFAGFKRTALAIIIIMGTGIGALAALPLLIPAQTVRNAVLAEIKTVTGFSLVINGDVSVSLFPWGTVSFTDVTLSGDNAAPALTAERLTAGLRIFPLLFGRIEAADLSLVRPRIAVTFKADGTSNWSGLVDSLGHVLNPNGKRTGDVMSFSEIHIDGGSIVVRDESHGLTETLTDLQLALAWPSISRSFATIGQFAWRNELINASISLNDLSAAILGERSGLKVRLNGKPFSLAFDGHVSYRPSLKMEGALALDADSLRQTLAWSGQQPLPGGGFGRFALKAQTNVVGTNVALSAVNVELDGNVAEGVLSFAMDGRTVVQGTLAADDLNLTPYVSTVHLLRDTERDWSSMPITLDGLSDFDVDLRLSAARIAVANAKLGRTAIAANLRGGSLNVTIGESQAFGGILKGSLGLAKASAGAEVKSQLQFTDIDLEKCLSELFGIARLEGNGDFTLAVDASGGSVLALTQTLQGSANLTAHDGALTGLNVEQLLRRLERRPLSGGGEFRSGRTPFTRLAINIKLAQGTASVEEVRLEGAAVRLGLAGTASIPSRDLDLKGTAGLVQAAANGAGPGFELPFVVQGPWDDPIMLPDTESLIRRSGAAAPLLDAVKDRRARDAIHSVIEQLTGGAPPPAPRANAAPATAPAAAATPR